MFGEAQQQFMQRIRAALAAGRDVDPPFAHTPEHIDPQVRRLVGEDEDLAARFTAAATEAGARVHAVADPTQAVTTVLDLLGEAGVKNVLVGEGGLVNECGMVDAIKVAGLRAVRWREIGEPNQEAFTFAAGLTGVDYALAESGSLVITPTAAAGRLVSLAPPLHVALVATHQILPDLIDLAAKLSQTDALRAQVNLITGPSKTADIELNLVKGVHGPAAVEVVLLPGR